MQDSEQAQDWIAATYQAGYSALLPEQRKTWYSNIADAYDRVRPRYPQALILRAIELAQLPANAQILEVGCGPGIATVPFAKLGFGMVCLEPSQSAYQLAQQNCAAYPNVEIQNTTFEEWPLEPKKFHAVLAATSFHWVSPETGYPKAAAALQDPGSLILLWNMTPQPAYEIYQALLQVYQRHAPSLARYETREIQAEYLQRLEQAALNSGQFKQGRSEQIACERTYSIEDYLALLSTLSPYIALDPLQREAVFVSLRDVLEQTCTGGIPVSYLSAFQIARKMKMLPCPLPPDS